MGKSAPQCSIPGLCSAAATIFALVMAFLGYWGFANPEPWKAKDILVVVPAFAGFAFLALVPWLITRPTEHDETGDLQKGRRSFLVGVACIWAALLVSLFV